MLYNKKFYLNFLAKSVAFVFKIGFNCLKLNKETLKFVMSSFFLLVFVLENYNSISLVPLKLTKLINPLTTYKCLNFHLFVLNENSILFIL